MTDGWEGLEFKPQDIRDANQSTDDLNRLVLRVFGNEEGQKLIDWLVTTYTDQPVAVPGADASYAYYREGQNSVVRDLIARIIKARNL